MGVPVGVRANLAVALATGGFDIVHGFEPGLPSLSYLALRDAAALTVATFFSPERLAIRPARTRRERLLGRLDALLATSAATAEARPSASPAATSSCRAASTSSASRPPRSGSVVVLEWRQTERPLAPRARARARGAARLGARAPADAAARRRGRRCRARCAAACACARRSTARPAPRSCATRRDLRAGRRRAPRASSSRRAPPAPPSRRRPAATRQPELAAAEAARLDRGRRRSARSARRGGPRGRASAELRRARDRRARAVYARHRPRRRRAPRRATPLEDARLDRRRPPHAHDVVARLLDRGRRADRPRRGGRARRDRGHRPQRLRRRARGRRARARPRADRHPRRGGEDRRPGRGDRPLPQARRSRAACPSPRPSRRSAPRAASSTSRTRSTGCTRSRTPRRSTATSPRSTSSRSTTRACSSRRYNDEALRFARKYNLTAGAGSDAHVLQGVGTGAVRMRRFEGPEEFLVSLRERRGPAPPEVARVPPGAEVGGPSQGKGPLEANHRWGSGDRGDRRNLREVPAKGDHRDQRSR